ncbi:hypothetical protein C2845_PM17G12080 [Panicum miliaceum]|uniref:Serpin domain-containing protein n=1 Tax=Panicum miliaceum TaxID=4540 RepID=A0A3L6PZ60_PANMI|nr:hypothetical protein C2845_PM17G12080 [Panicum miliaceum]
MRRWRWWPRAPRAAPRGTNCSPSSARPRRAARAVRGRRLGGRLPRRAHRRVPRRRRRVLQLPVGADRELHRRGVKPKAAVKTINKSVKKAMDSLIDDIICESDVAGVATDIVLANAVYFKGVWQHSFHPHGTWPGTFFRLDGSHAEASFMTAFGTMWIACFDGF